MSVAVQSLTSTWNIVGDEVAISLEAEFIKG